VQKLKNNDQSRSFLVEAWSIEGYVIKEVEGIVTDFGLLILHKTKVVIL